MGAVGVILGEWAFIYDIALYGGFAMGLAWAVGLGLEVALAASIDSALAVSVSVRSGKGSEVSTTLSRKTLFMPQAQAQAARRITSRSRSLDFLA